MDVTHHSKEDGIEMGNGPVLTVGGPNIHKGYFKKLDDYARKNGFSVQYDYGSGHTGTDADVVQLAGNGTPTLLLSLPQLFMHTPVEVVQVCDILIRPDYFLDSSVHSRRLRQYETRKTLQTL